MARSPGLRRPERARGPAVSMRWHDSGIPFQPRSCTPCCSVSPGLRAPEEVLHPLRRVAGGVLERDELLDLVDGPQARGRVDEEVVGVLDGTARPDELTQGVHEVGRRLEPVAPGVRLPARDPDAHARGDSLVLEIVSRGRDRSRGWSVRLRSWNSSRRIGRGAAPAMPKHSLPTRIAGSPAGPTMSRASSKRGSKPVRYDRLALCSRSP